MEEIAPQKEKRWWAQKNPEKYRAYREKNKERARIWSRQWREKNPERARELGRISDRKRYYRDKDKRIAFGIRTKYGIDLEDYKSLFEKQHGVCAICGKEESARSQTGEVKKLAIDHCHKTGAVRGLLCAACNNTLGQAKDNIETLSKAIAYLKAHAKDGTDASNRNGRES